MNQNDTIDQQLAALSYPILATASRDSNRNQSLECKGLFQKLDGIASRRVGAIAEGGA